MNGEGVPKYESENIIDSSHEVMDEDSSSYFESYENIDVHRLMLQDEVRTKCYMNAIDNASDLFKDKTVMDVGAGTGILSLFCVKAGAKKVYAVEASNLASILPQVAKKNGYEDIIEVVHSKVEDLKMKIQVDIIVSEWMGFYLLHESMLESVLFARDNFLKQDGLLFPNSSQIYAAPCKVPDLWKNKAAFWESRQYGFNLSPFSEIAKVASKPEIFTVASENLLSDPQLLFDMNLQTVKPEILKSLTDRRFFSIEEDGDMQAVCIWFTCDFPAVPDKDSITLSTAPWDPETHWKQTVILFPSQTTFEAGDIMGWNFKIEKESLEPFSRSYRIILECLDESEEHPKPCECGSVKCEIIKHYLESHQTPDHENENF